MQSPSWEAISFAASQEIPPISRNPKVHYRTHKRPPPVPILGQPNPVHIPTSHFLEIHIIHPSTPRSLQWSPSLQFPPPRPYTLPSPHPYAPHAQSILFFLILSPTQYRVMPSPPFPCYNVPPRSKYSPQYHILKHPQLPFLPQCQRPSFTLTQNNRQNYSVVLCNSYFIFRTESFSLSMTAKPGLARSALQ